MVRGELRVSLTVPNVDCVSPGFHVKHVDTELSVIAEVRGHRRTLDELRRNGCGCMTCRNVGCRDNRSAGWGVAWNHREVRTRPDQCLPPLAEWIDLGRGAEPAATLRLEPLCWSLAQVGEGAASPKLTTPVQDTMTPRGRSSSRPGARSVDRHGSVGNVGRERRGNTTSVSRETAGHFGFGAWKCYRCQRHERCCICFRWLTPR